MRAVEVDGYHFIEKTVQAAVHKSSPYRALSSPRLDDKKLLTSQIVDVTHLMSKGCMTVSVAVGTQKPET